MRIICLYIFLSSKLYMSECFRCVQVTSCAQVKLVFISLSLCLCCSRINKLIRLFWLVEHEQEAVKPKPLPPFAEHLFNTQI